MRERERDGMKEKEMKCERERERDGMKEKEMKCVRERGG